MDKKVEKKEKIVEGATKLFSKFGMDKTTMKEIADFASIGKATLYYYFENKKEIYKEVVKKETDIIKDEIIEAIENAKTQKDKLIAYVVTRLKHVQKICNYYGRVKVRQSYFKNYPVIEKLRKDFDEFEKELIHDLLSQGVEKGAFDIDDVELATRAFYAGIRGSEYQLQLPEQNNMENIQQNVETLMSMIFRGIER